MAHFLKLPGSLCQKGKPFHPSRTSGCYYVNILLRHSARWHCERSGLTAASDGLISHGALGPESARHPRKRGSSLPSAASQPPPRAHLLPAVPPGVPMGLLGRTPPRAQWSRTIRLPWAAGAPLAAGDPGWALGWLQWAPPGVEPSASDVRLQHVTGPLPSPQHAAHRADGGGT